MHLPRSRRPPDTVKKGCGRVYGELSGRAQILPYRSAARSSDDRGRRPLGVIRVGSARSATGPILIQKLSRPRRSDSRAPFRPARQGRALRVPAADLDRRGRARVRGPVGSAGNVALVSPRGMDRRIVGALPSRCTAPPVTLSPDLLIKNSWSKATISKRSWLETSRQ